jgi:hypothetical protein
MKTLIVIVFHDWTLYYYCKVCKQVYEGALDTHNDYYYTSKEKGFKPINSVFNMMFHRCECHPIMDPYHIKKLTKEEAETLQPQLFRDDKVHITRYIKNSTQFFEVGLAFINTVLIPNNDEAENIEDDIDNCKAYPVRSYALFQPSIPYPSDDIGIAHDGSWIFVECTSPKTIQVYYAALCED